MSVRHADARMPRLKDKHAAAELAGSVQAPKAKTVKKVVVQKKPSRKRG